MDTYCVGKSQQSESTMHTVMRRRLTSRDFSVAITAQTLDRLNGLREDGIFWQLKGELPESFLQRRIICTNYQALRRIVRQRRGHRLREWQYFISEVLDQIEHEEFFKDVEAA